MGPGFIFPMSASKEKLMSCPDSSKEGLHEGPRTLQL